MNDEIIFKAILRRHQEFQVNPRINALIGHCFIIPDNSGPVYRCSGSIIIQIIGRRFRSYYRIAGIHSFHFHVNPVEMAFTDQ